MINDYLSAKKIAYTIFISSSLQVIFIAFPCFLYLDFPPPFHLCLKTKFRTSALLAFLLLYIHQQNDTLTNLYVYLFIFEFTFSILFPSLSHRDPAFNEGH